MVSRRGNGNRPLASNNDAILKGAVETRVPVVAETRAAQSGAKIKSGLGRLPGEGKG